jgi:hypothetical protein
MMMMVGFPRWRIVLLFHLSFLLDIMAMPHSVPAKRPLPATILLGYSSRCDYDKVERAVSMGVNVVAWAFFTMPHKFDGACLDSENSKAGDCALLSRLDTGFDIPCIRQLIQRLDNDGYDDVVHLTSLGGWNGPHLDPDISASTWYEQWKRLCGSTFHGLDWDLEGNDDLESPYNVFTIECLDKMGEISRLAKQGAK